MTFFQALLIGIIQGVTEFLPISSSGHLTLVQHLLGIGHLEQMLLFDLFCHLGTLLAIIIIFWNSIISLNRSTLFLIALGTAPLFFILPILKEIESTYQKPELLWLFFLITAFILYTGTRFHPKKKTPPKMSSFLIGIAQTIALFPGVSRSGTTISAARLLGWKKEEAVTYSFLLAIPAILGGVLLKGGSAILYPTSSIALPLSCYLTGFLSSFIIGIGSLKLLIFLFAKDQFMYFVYYCLIAACASIILFNT